MYQYRSLVKLTKKDSSRQKIKSTDSKQYKTSNIQSLGYVNDARTYIIKYIAVRLIVETFMVSISSILLWVIFNLTMPQNLEEITVTAKVSETRVNQDSKRFKEPARKVSELTILDKKQSEDKINNLIHTKQNKTICTDEQNDKSMVNGPVITI